MEYTHIVTQVLWNPWPAQHVVRHHTVRMMCSGSSLAKHFQREELIRLHFLKHQSTHFLVPVPVRDGFDVDVCIGRDKQPDILYPTTRMDVIGRYSTSCLSLSRPFFVLLFYY